MQQNATHVRIEPKNNIQDRYTNNISFIEIIQES